MLSFAVVVLSVHCFPVYSDHSHKINISSSIAVFLYNRCIVASFHKKKEIKLLSNAMTFSQAIAILNNNFANLLHMHISHVIYWFLLGAG